MAAAAAAATVKFSAPAPASYCCHVCLISYVTPGLKEAIVSSCLLKSWPFLVGNGKKAVLCKL